MARLFIQLPNTAPIAPQSCSAGPAGTTCRALLHLVLVRLDQHLPVIGGQLDVVVLADPLLVLLQQVLEVVLAHAHHDVGVHLHEAAVASYAKRSLPVLRARLRTVSSLRPRLRTVSIMPGMEARAPERTETSSGSLGRRTWRP